MWKSRVLLLALSALLLCSFSAFSAEPLAEEEVRTWAATQTRVQLTEKLVEAVRLIETLDVKLANSETKLKKVEEQSAISAEAFERSLRLKSLEIAKLTRARWTDRIKYGAGGFVAGALAAELSRPFR